MVLDAMLVGGMIGNYAARGQFESMSLAQQQQSQIEQAQAQAAQAEQAAKAARKQCMRQRTKVKMICSNNLKIS
jgi:hypothetical protein